MAEVFFPFDAGPGSEVREGQWRAMAQHWLESGVLARERQRLEVFADSSGLSVKVRPGTAWVLGHYYDSGTERTLPIATADATNPRVDRVVLRADFVANTVSVAVLQGSPGPSPTAPPVTQNSGVVEIMLAQVTVAAGATNIAAEDVRDERNLVATRGAWYDPGPVGTPPSSYPHGRTVGTVSVDDGWPTTGTLTTDKRSGSRVWQEVVQSRSTLAAVVRYFRQGVYSATAGTPNGWGPWQLVRDGELVQVSDLTAAETTTSTAYANLTSVGPSASVTVGPSGKVRVSISADMANGTAGQTCYASTALSGALSSVASDARALRFTSSTAGAGAQFSREVVFTGLAPGTLTVTMQYRVTGGTGTFSARRMNVEAL